MKKIYIVLYGEYGSNIFSVCSTREMAQEVIDNRPDIAVDEDGYPQLHIGEIILDAYQYQRDEGLKLFTVNTLGEVEEEEEGVFPMQSIKESSFHIEGVHHVSVYAKDSEDAIKVAKKYL